MLSSFYSTRCWNTTAGICFCSDTRASVRSGTDFGLAVGIPDHWMFRSGLCAGQSSFSTPNHFYFMDLALCTYVVVKLEQKSIFQKLLQESLRHIILWNSTVWWSIHFVFAEITNIAKLIKEAMKCVSCFMFFFFLMQPPACFDLLLWHHVLFTAQQTQ